MTKLYTYTATSTVHRGKTFVSVPAKLDVEGRPTCEGCAFNPNPEDPKCLDGCEEPCFPCELDLSHGRSYIAVPREVAKVAEATEQIDEISNNTALLMESLWTPVETEAQGALSYDFDALETAWFCAAKDALEHEEIVYNKEQLWLLPLMISGYTFKRTCYACPEQYDVFVGDTKVAHVRLRHSKLKCVVPGVGGIEVYSNTLDGDDVGIFSDTQRFYYLNECADAITQFCVSGRDVIVDRMAVKLLNELLNEETNEQQTN